jgi:molybdate transport system substrate-binding protein
MLRVARALGLGLAVAVLTGCGQPTDARSEIVVFAASSLTDAFTDLGARFQDASPGTRVTFNFGASSQLRTQLSQGARADVFASADQPQMEAASAASVLQGPPRVFARNRLVIIAPKGNPAHLTDLADLAREGLKLVAAQPNVPIGQYTTDLLERASADATYGPDFRARVESNIVSREDNVRQVVAKVQLGEADAAVVYATDATPQVDQLPITDRLQTLATYPIAVARGSNPAGGQAFVAYVLSPAGTSVLARWGFLPP